MNAQTFFSDEEKSRIVEAVREAEGRTSGEIVPMVVDASYDYPLAEAMGGGFFALGTATLASWAFGGSSIWIFLPIFMLLYLPFKRLVHVWPGLKRRLIPEGEITAELEEKALVSFIESGLHKTRDNTGILILISLFEHRVYVLADCGIHAAVPPRTWDEIAATLTDGIRRGKACEALCEAVRRCGDLLQEPFPPRPDDRDELPNILIGPPR